MFALLATLLSASLLCRIEAYPSFQQEIPNGGQVPHPCNITTIWPGVGHEIDAGSGPFNPFGRDFHAAGMKWTKALCAMDSDGDGRSNGQELGDPDCTWVSGATPAVTHKNQLSHPGVCEPLDAGSCRAKNAFLSKLDTCTMAGVMNKTEWCPAIRDSEVKSITLRFSEFQIPANDTSYLCQEFTLPSDDDYQIIAWEPFISNAEIMHHMIYFACDKPFDLMRLDMIPGQFKKPAVCTMDAICSSYSMFWAFGQPNRCYNDDTGVAFGKSSYHRTILQIHYNNPSKKQNYVDSSGIVLYYVKKQRSQNIGTLLVGQMEVMIPPRTPVTAIKNNGMAGKCGATLLAGNPKYNLTSMLFHMHQIGVYGKVQVTKNTTKKVITLLDQKIAYDRPVILTWGDGSSEPVEIEPGDSISVECRYDSRNRNEWTFYGERTTNEMCMAIFEIYPPPGNQLSAASIDLGQYDICALLNDPGQANCSMADFANMVNYTRFNNLGSFESCLCSGDYPAMACSSDCYSFLNRTGWIDHPTCLKGALFNLLSVFNGVITTFDTGYMMRSQLDNCLALKEPPPKNTTCRNPITPLDAVSARSKNNGAVGLTVQILPVTFQLLVALMAKC